MTHLSSVTPSGPSGLAGINGDRGLPGPQGPDGNNGRSGNPGLQGELKRKKEASHSPTVGHKMKSRKYVAYDLV